MEHILEIKGLSKQFYLHEQGREIKSCRDISFTLDKGGFIGIVGTSGAGKSTVLRCIYRTYSVTTGSVMYSSAESRNRICIAVSEHTSPHHSPGARDQRRSGRRLFL